MAKTLAKIIVGMLTVPDGYEIRMWSHPNTSEGETFRLEINPVGDDSYDATHDVLLDADYTIEKINEEIKKTVKWMEEGEE